MDRTISIEKAEEQFRDRLQWAEKQRAGAAADGVSIDVAYFEAYRKHLKELLEPLGNGGLSESELKDERRSACEEWQRIENPDEKDMEYVARRDAAKHILQRCFGYAISIGKIVRGSTCEDGQVRLIDDDGREITVTVEDNGDALSVADLFLRKAGYSVSDLEKTPEKSE
jgi:hypothetical protein